MTIESTTNQMPAIGHRETYAAICEELAGAMHDLPKDATREHVIGAAVMGLMRAKVNPNVVHKFAHQARQRPNAETVKRLVSAWKNHYTMLLGTGYEGLK